MRACVYMCIRKCVFEEKICRPCTCVAVWVLGGGDNLRWGMKSVLCQT